MQLGDGSVVRLTVSRYYTPTGRSIQKPYKSLNNYDYYDEYRKRYISGELTDSTLIEVADSLKFVTPKGNVVYGGGGIIPDVFVPIHKDEEYEKLYYVINSNLMSNFVFSILEKDRKYYNGLSKKELIESTVVLDETVLQFKNHIKPFLRWDLSIGSYNYDAQIRRAIKSEMASQLFDDNVAYQIKEEDDSMIKKVKELLSKQN
jgi:carboxyl-terminal processing protease